MSTAKKRYPFSPDYAVAPGETLREVIESLGMSQVEFAKRTGLSTVSVSRILVGDQAISYETANLLELVTGVRASFWNNLEANYREQLLKMKALEDQKQQIDWVKSIPTRELIRRGYIEECSDKATLLQKVLAFYGVGNVDAYHKMWQSPDVAARRSQCFESRPGPASAWLRIGEIEASKIKCAPYDKNQFRQALLAIRKLTVQDPQEFVPTLISLCASAGVALALVKEMKQVPWNGASKWLTSDKAMILLSLRGKGEDKFWFSFFHEAGHILNDSKRAIQINDGEASTPEEIRANDFAAEILIPQHKYNQRICSARSREDIAAIAEELCIANGIVAGRYQHLTGKWSFFKDMIRRFEWTRDCAS